MLLIAPLIALALAAAEPPPVYRLKAEIDAPIMAGAALAITLPTLLASDIIRERCPCDPSGINSFDRGAVGNHDAFADVTSDVTAVVAMLGPPLLDLLDVGTGAAFRSDVLVFAEVLLVNGALVEAAKYVVQRPLPRTYAGDPALIQSPGGYRSFYSGHTSTVFAALTATAMTIRLRHGEQVWPWIAAGVIGSSVAVERVAAGRHFPSDVLVGAAVGTLVGVLVPALHAGESGVRVVPTAHGAALAVRW